MKNKKQGSVFFLLVLSGLLLFFLSIFLGTVSIAPAELLTLLQGEGNRMLRDIIFRIRLPRALGAFFLGGALGVSGYLLQSFFHNPIVGPFVLGISSGAKMTVAFTMVVLLGMGQRMTAMMEMGAAFFGALLSMGVVLLLAGKTRRMSELVVGGVMIGYICNAVTELLVTFARDTDIVNLHNWSRGSFSGMNLSHIAMLLPPVLLCLVWSFFLAKPMGAFQMGESYARNLGVNVGLLKLQLVLCACLLSAVSVALAGPISFVGVAVPQIMRRILKSGQPLLLLPACFLGGGVACLFCDLLARTLLSPTELSLSTVTAIFFAPVLIYTMLQRQKREA